MFIKTKIYSENSIGRGWYKDVIVSKEGQSIWRVLLDSFKLKTVTGNLLYTPNEIIAKLIAFEWSSIYVKDNPQPKVLLPLTSLVNKGIDITKNERHRIINNLKGTLDADDLLWRSKYPELKVEQDKLGNEIINWFNKQYSCELKVFQESLEGTPQSKNISDIFDKELNQLDDWSLVGLNELNNLVKSLIMSWAVLYYRATSQEAMKLACLESEWQLKKFGQIPAHRIQKSDIYSKVTAACLFLYCLPLHRKQ